MAPQAHYHAMQFYNNSQGLATAVARFVAKGFPLGQPAVVVSTSKHSAAIVAELGRLGLNVDELKATGELQILDARKLMGSFMVARRPDRLMFESNVADLFDRLCVGRRRSSVRLYGEMVDLLWKDGNVEAALRLEALWNHQASTHDFSLLCAYDAENFTGLTGAGVALASACQLHTHVLEAAT